MRYALSRRETALRTALIARKVPKLALISRNLKSLEISGDGLSPKFIHIESLEFLRQMPGLTSLVILVARLKSKDYSPILSLKSITHLSLPPQHALFGLFDELSALPNLKTGLLKERAEIYKKK